MKRPLISVLVPTYNQAPYLGEALDSLLAQSFPDWEAIVVNDGSTDSTAEVLETYGAKDPRFTIVNKENGGVASALNLGLQRAKGEWICWLSSDDFFDKEKLKIHRDWIQQHPSCRFFFTHFKELNDATRTLTTPPMWSPAPPREWQVLEMLRHTYVHGNSICVYRKLFDRVGAFDQGLGHGQDYDMWLRLLAAAPAIFIPKRTCITRLSPLQMSHGFSEAAIFDCAKSGINFLAQRSFEEWFPSLDLNDPRTARRALIKALELAANPYSFVYSLGAHPLLLFRILEWISHRQPSEISAAHRLFRRRAREVMRIYPETALAFAWKTAALASFLVTPRINYASFRPGVIGEMEYWRLRAANDPRAELLRRYLERFEGKSLSNEPSSQDGRRGELLFIYQPEEHDPAPVEVTSQFADAAGHMMRRGWQTALISSTESDIRMVDGGLLVSAPDKNSLARALASLEPLDIAIEIQGKDDLTAFAGVIDTPAKKQLGSKAKTDVLRRVEQVRRKIRTAVRR